MEMSHRAAEAPAASTVPLALFDAIPFQDFFYSSQSRRSRPKRISATKQMNSSHQSLVSSHKI